jgi:leader peptidase (prepilin peptidase)/N-methyltransferase
LAYDTPIVTELILFLFGLVVGSFLNVCIYRFPRCESIIFPGSHCPDCGHAICWYDNIPVLSFLFLKGKCRHCQKPIARRYPIVELISGLIWVLCWTGLGWTAFFWISLLFLSLLLVVTVTDFETGLIPDRVTFVGMGAGLLISAFYLPLHSAANQWLGAGTSIIGLLAGGILIYVTGFLGSLVFKKEAMGQGDIKLMAMIGSFLGWQNVVLTFFAAPFLALPFALYARFIRKEETVPYGPFLALAGAILFFLGDNIWQYLFPY